MVRKRILLQLVSHPARWIEPAASESIRRSVARSANLKPLFLLVAAALMSGAAVLLQVSSMFETERHLLKNFLLNSNRYVEERLSENRGTSTRVGSISIFSFDDSYCFVRSRQPTPFEPFARSTSLPYINRRWGKTHELADRRTAIQAASGAKQQNELNRTMKEVTNER